MIFFYFLFFYFGVALQGMWLLAKSPMFVFQLKKGVMDVSQQLTLANAHVVKLFGIAEHHVRFCILSYHKCCRLRPTCVIVAGNVTMIEAQWVLVYITQYRLWKNKIDMVCYCGSFDDIQKSEWKLHRLECQALSRLDSNKRKSVTPSIRLMLKLYLRRKLQDQKVNVNKV